MLHKSFKSSKCKTSLKLVASRTKLLKNKKEVVVKQLKKELAQLLESGQDQTARIRVEHVVREEKMMAAYELLELFCELIALRLPIIESQKNCPIDLKEAVTSVIFAAPRCSDIPELVDVRKHFTAKYGKDFVSGAIELRPDCGVNRQLVEKLSAKAPDGQTKLKILTAIAKEYNINWEPKAFGEKDANPHEDLLNGPPKTFGDASNVPVESSNVRASYYDQRVPDTHSVPQNEVKQEAPVNYQGNNVRSSLGTQNVTPADVSAAASPNHYRKPSGNGMDRMESGNVHSEVQSPNFVDRQNWNMEFTDATAAAQAAAESAERASMAARAAAQLSSRGRTTTGQSTGSPRSPAYARDEIPRRHSRSSFDGEAFSRGHTDNGYERPQNEISEKKQHDFKSTQTNHLSGAASTSDSFKGNRPSSRPPANGTGHESTQRHGGWEYQDQSTRNEDEEEEEEEEEELDLATLTGRLRAGGRQSESGSRPSSSEKSGEDFSDNTASSHSRRNSQNIPQSEDVRVDQYSMRGQSEKFEEEPCDETKYGSRTEKAKEDERFRKDLTGGYSFSGSPSSNSFNNRRHDVESNSQNLENSDTNPFANFEKEKFHRGPTSNDGGSVVFDNYGSDGETSVFDLDKGPETSSDVFSPERKGTSYQPENVSAPSPRRSRIDLFGGSVSESHSRREHVSASVFSEANDDDASRVHQDALPPAIFDDAGGPLSEDEEELENFGRDREDSLYSRSKKSQFSLIGEGSAKFDDQTDKGSQESPRHSRVSSVHDADDDDSVLKKSAAWDDSETLGRSSYDDDTELPFGKLTGGLRNKGYRHPPYVKSSLAEKSPSRQEAAGEAEKFSVSSPKSATSSRSEIDGDQHDQDVRSQKQSVRDSYRSSFGDATESRRSSEVAAKQSSFSSATRKGSIDSDSNVPYTQDETNKRSSGRVEEKSLRSSLDEAPVTKAEVTDSSIEYDWTKPQEQTSGGRVKTNYRGLESEEGKRSSPRQSISSYDLEQSDSEEAKPQVSSSRTRYGTALSRRTKGSPLKSEQGSAFKPSPVSEEAERQEPVRFSSGSSYSYRRSEAKAVYSTERPETQVRSDNKPSSRSSLYRPSPVREEEKTRETPKISPRSSYSERSEVKSSYPNDEGNRERSADVKSPSWSLRSKPSPPSEEETREPSRFSSRSSYSDKRSDVKSTYPSEEVRTPEGRAETKSSSRGSHDNETYRTTRTQRTALETGSSSDRVQQAKVVERPKPELRKSTDRPSGSPQASGSSGPSESSKPTKPSLEDTSRENSFNRASHVHPKLPDYDTIAAQLEALRANRK